MQANGTSIIKHVVQYSPSPEIPEIMYLIGRGIILQNEGLWSEKIALQEIVCEMMETAPFSDLSTAVGGPKKVSKAKIFREAITFSKLHYGENVEVQYPIDAIDFLSKRSFDAEYVQQNLEHIRHLIDIENTELERAIVDLQKIIAGEELTEITPRSSRDHSTAEPTSSSNTKSHPLPDSKSTYNNTTTTSFTRSKEIPSSNNNNNNNNNSNNRGTAASGTLYKSASLPSDVSFFSDVSSSTMTHSSRQSTMNSTNNNSNNQSHSANASPNNNQQHSSSEFIPSSTRTSKFRGRLRDAQAELFLADEL